MLQKFVFTVEDLAKIPEGELWRKWFKQKMLQQSMLSLVIEIASIL